MGKIHLVGSVLEACVAAGVPLAGVHRVPGLHGGRVGDLRGVVAADHQADGVSLAYMFKGTGVVFGLLLAHFVFGEAITTTNIVGAAISS